VQAGAGIVADSTPADEWQETLNKARGLLEAIELAQGKGGIGDWKEPPRRGDAE
jgi:anthranilate/para-aminobenzoate synthase component I